MRIRGSVARRAVLGAGLVFLTAACWWSATSYRASALGETRTLSIFNIHSKETITVTYKRDGKYDDAALKRLNTFMRDWRANKETTMDPELIDHIWMLHKELGSEVPVHLICGYRTAETNASLRKKGGGQAKRSQHILGKAADITFPDVPVKVLRNSALVWQWGGVGYYPTSGIPFVHVDTGNVRMWPRIPRLELAALFPSGHSKYLPKDGKPITPKDYQIAMAQGLVSQTKIASAVRLKPALEPEDAADADDVVDTDIDTTVAQAEPDAAPLTQTEPGAVMPRPILASFTPDTAGEPAIAADTHEQGTPPPPAKLFAYASVGGMSLPSLLPEEPNASKQPALPRYESAAVVGAPEADDDHPDETNYAPFEIASLMTDASVAFSRTVAPLTHPDQANLDYLFDDMNRPTAFTLRKSSGYAGLAAAQQFSGHAVKSLYSNIAMDTPAPAPTQLAENTR
jgi:uncharacterized protein YcbK (DUF882 family)